MHVLKQVVPNIFAYYHTELNINHTSKPMESLISVIEKVLVLIHNAG